MKLPITQWFEIMVRYFNDGESYSIKAHQKWCAFIDPAHSMHSIFKLLNNVFGKLFILSSG